MAYEEVTSPILTDATGQDIVDKLDEIAQNLQPPTNIEASDVGYDNTQSGMTATDVQEAVDELKSNLIKYVDYSITLSTNQNVSPFKSIGTKNLNGALSGHNIVSLTVMGGTSTQIACPKYVESGDYINVYGNAAFTCTVRVGYI